MISQRAAGIASPFFSERHVAVIPLDKTKLCAQGGRRTSQTRSFLSDTPRLYRSIKRIYVRRVGQWAPPAGIADPFFSERHVALIALDKTRYLFGG